MGFINIYSVAKYQKTRKGDSFETLKNFRKKLHNAEKNRKGGPFCTTRNLSGTDLAWSIEQATICSLA